jgi:hypothetical protein
MNLFSDFFKPAKATQSIQEGQAVSQVFMAQGLRPGERFQAATGNYD